LITVNLNHKRVDLIIDEEEIKTRFNNLNIVILVIKHPGKKLQENILVN